MDITSIVASQGLFIPDSLNQVIHMERQERLEPPNQV